MPWSFAGLAGSCGPTWRVVDLRHRRGFRKLVRRQPVAPPKVSTHHFLAVTSEEVTEFRAIYGKRDAEAANVVRPAELFFDVFELAVRDAVAPGDWPLGIQTNA